MKKINRFTKSQNLALRLFIILLLTAIAIWVLRGLGIITFLPGGIIWILLLVAIAAGVFSRFQRRWVRF
ncbi:MAG: hypothetical protein CLLPBCKN_002708 [Chroococcidiopsis cubana SAG 39.79]|jgi:flagellar biogenesis protein FliO|uniref:Uncharacterized protein n=1 Tax=Chroococcidiopsis thermalis (strain PCC 7203) TaxID=251229 RepID=K9TU46_CHRTP|nr:MULTISPECIES: hypothetical protein [Chroococcidiopsis]AFY86085.1 hypothetical protein Chro_0539 [Chroococcidiopsis thermalis PCC 7203]MDZ4873312.1 hypothetical protein [Chroococcidiopsis cubana SAG 39.79]PSB41616.1 hypothetical protein C7B80_30170 [Cyanosarcina cf. burmensis CCALA 770]PSB55057.1 hypothetical protein C7B79_34040 [Chroococcidiopsis cubana CCALA 043]